MHLSGFVRVLRDLDFALWVGSFQSKILTWM